MKIITFYLPQFHTFPENDEWWGKGFTEWKNVKGAFPQYKGHYQPRIPLNDNYYDLTDTNVLKWQAKLARENGVYGFCFYHYWFDGKLLMEKPMENLLNDPTIEINYCICWANETWTKAWAQHSKEILIQQTYSNEKEWDRHFNYLLPFFKDKRYIHMNSKPIMVIYRPEQIENLENMLTYWNNKAKAEGLEGLCFISQQSEYNIETDSAGYLFDYGIEYQPDRAMKSLQVQLPMLIKRGLNRAFIKFGFKRTKYSTYTFNYDKVWKTVLHTLPQNEKSIPGAFVDWDNTPRYKEYARIFDGYTPEKFEKYLEQQIIHARNEYKKDMIFMFAWNEWGEGGYLEPDEKYGEKTLKAIKTALINTNEFPY